MGDLAACTSACWRRCGPVRRERRSPRASALPAQCGAVPRRAIAAANLRAALPRHGEPLPARAIGVRGRAAGRGRGSVDGDVVRGDRHRGEDRGFRPARGRAARDQLPRRRARSRGGGLARGGRPEPRSCARHRRRPDRARAARPVLAQGRRCPGAAGSRATRIGTWSGATTRPGSPTAWQRFSRLRSATSRRCSSLRTRSSGSPCSSRP